MSPKFYVIRYFLFLHLFKYRTLDKLKISDCTLSLSEKKRCVKTRTEERKDEVMVRRFNKKKNVFFWETTRLNVISIFSQMKNKKQPKRASLNENLSKLHTFSDNTILFSSKYISLSFPSRINQRSLKLYNG